MAESIQSCFERYEKKYRITQEQQMQIINGMQTHMQADKFGNYTICNIYYDTDDWQLVRASIEKPIYKEKLRVRSYGVPDENGRVFVELKKKYDGVVYKRRITASPEAAQQLLSGEAPGENLARSAARSSGSGRVMRQSRRCSSDTTAWLSPAQSSRS